MKLLHIIDTTPGLQYHLDNELPLYENIYRYSSEGFIDLFGEARKLYFENKLALCEIDRDLLENTDLGLYGIYEGEKVPLDLPLEETSETEDINEVHPILGKLLVTLVTAFLKFFAPILVEFVFDLISDLKRDVLYVTRVLFDKDFDEMKKLSRNKVFLDEAKDLIIKKRGFKWMSMPHHAAREFMKLPEFQKSIDKLTQNLSDQDKQEVIDKIEEHFVNAIRSEKFQNGIKKLYQKELEHLNEAKYQGKEVKLNKPKRGGPKKFYVYVKNPKTGKIKKVNFGDSGNLSVKINEPGARARFAARHNCKDKKDKTKAGYWSCNIGRYWKSLGGSKNFSGYW